MAGKPIRLGKAAGELNVGLPTIVEFLVTKGIKIDSNPNTRLEPEHFDLLLKEFAADQSMMEKAKGTSNRRERRETVTMSDIVTPEEKKVIKEEEDEGDAINLEEIKRNIESTVNFSSMNESFDALRNPDLLKNRIQGAFDSFKSQVGRNMTYSEMREMMG